MCRNIRQLFNFEPPATADEIRAAAIQYVRKVSGTRKPTQANDAIFAQAIDEVAAATSKLIDNLVTAAPPKNREEEMRKGRARWQKRALRIRDV